MHCNCRNNRCSEETYYRRAHSSPRNINIRKPTCTWGKPPIKTQPFLQQISREASVLTSARTATSKQFKAAHVFNIVPISGSHFVHIGTSKAGQAVSQDKAVIIIPGLGTLKNCCKVIASYLIVS